MRKKRVGMYGYFVDQGDGTMDLTETSCSRTHLLKIKRQAMATGAKRRTIFIHKLKLDRSIGRIS
jgi:hypothetical protein